MSSLAYQPEPDLQAMIYSTPLCLHQMKLKYQMLLLGGANVPIHKRHNQCLHNSIIVMMMMAMTTTIYCNKIWMQMYLKIFPITVILFLAQKHFMKNSVTLQVVILLLPFHNRKYDNSMVVNVNFATAIFNNTNHWHHCPHSKERGPHVNKKMNKDNDE